MRALLGAAACEDSFVAGVVGDEHRAARTLDGDAETFPHRRARPLRGTDVDAPVAFRSTAAGTLGDHVEQLGRGIRRVRKLLAANGNPPLDVEVDGFTRLTVWRRQA
jgi:hypothetical protein